MAGKSNMQMLAGMLLAPGQAAEPIGGEGDADLHRTASIHLLLTTLGQPSIWGRSDQRCQNSVWKIEAHWSRTEPRWRDTISADAMIELCLLIASLYRRYWSWLGGISALLTVIKIGDLVVPFLAGKVLESLGHDASAQRTILWLAAAVAVWVVHGNVLPWLYNSVDAKKVELFARRDVSLWSLDRAKQNTAGQDTALLQTIIERGETVIPEFMASITRVLLPSVIPCVAVIVALMAISPMLFLALAIGCSLYAAITLYMNRLLMPQYADLQDVDNRREQLRIKIFRALAKPACPIDEMIEAYGQRYTKVASVGSQVRACYLNFDLSRGIVINVMNACTWVVGIQAVRSDQFGLAVFIAFISWSTACISYVQVATAIHKQWLETGPAIRNYFSVVGGMQPTTPKTESGVSPVLQPAE